MSLNKAIGDIDAIGKVKVKSTRANLTEQSPMLTSKNRLRVRPSILCAGCEPYNSAQHETDHCEDDETNVATCEVLVVFGKSPAATKPAVGALNDPALGYHLKALGDIRALDDLKRDAGLLLHLVGGQFALVAAIGDGLLE